MSHAVLNTFGTKSMERLEPLQRLQALGDPGSLRVIDGEPDADGNGREGQEDAGVVAASARVAGRPVFCFAEDARRSGGSLGARRAAVICRVLELAGEAGAPIVGFVESAGARMQEGPPALAAYARVFRATIGLSGRVPQISIVTGTSAGGGSYFPALTDFVVMTRRASMFLTGPKVVSAVLGEEVHAAELGGTRVHERNGVCHFVVEDELEAASVARRLLSYLPQSSSEAPPEVAIRPAMGKNPGSCVPRSPRLVYDVREVARRLVDGGELLEMAPKWGRSIFTGFAHLEGQSIGIIANQPRYLGGVIDATGAQKGAEFVRTCSSFGLPLLVLVDTPGFMPGTRQESVGIIRHGARLLHAFAEAEVPKISTVIRQAYGGGYITMNSRDLGADLALAWPRAAIGIMGARQVVGIIQRRAIAESPDRDAAVERLAQRYAAKHQGAAAAVREGVVDEVILPADTRARLGAALRTLAERNGRPS